MREVKTAVVTGATSFIGSAVARKLLSRGCDVYGIVRPSSRSMQNLPVHERFHPVISDLANTGNWLRQIITADTFFHFAWGGPGISGRSDPLVQKESADLALLCLRASKELGVTRFFLSGSQAEYGRVSGKITESAECHPVVEYGRQKLRVSREAPAIADSLGIEYVHARFFSVYGPGDHPYTLIPSCIRTFSTDGTMELSECTNTWNFLHVSDAADAALLLAECELGAPSCIVNLAGNDTRVLRDFVEEIRRLCGGHGVCAYGKRHVPEKPTDSWPDTEKIFSMIPWSPKISFEEGIKELIRIERGEKDG